MDFDAEEGVLLAIARDSALPGLGFGWMDAGGAVEPARGIHAWITSRMTHVFSLADIEGEHDARAMAALGVDSLLTGPLRDRVGGGWHGGVDIRGVPLSPHKLAYDHAFIVLAGCSAAAAGVPRAEELLDEAAGVLDRHFLDEAGRVVDGYPTDFADADPYRGANSSMHTVEALLALGDVRGDPEHGLAALRIAEHLVHEVAMSFDGRLPEHYDRDWNPLPDYNADNPADQFRPYGVTPGHLLEWSRLLLQLEASLAQPPSWLAEDAETLFHKAVGLGWDVDGRPGFVYTTDWRDRPVVRSRLHWVHAEAVAAAAALAARTGSATYAAWEHEWWRFIETCFCDGSPGLRRNWRHELDADNLPAAQIWAGRPDVYHAYQALLIRRLPSGASLSSRIGPPARPS
jgi:mannose/cellobiose epimerase-like protein (N-acyl-D-glucosamine 2-epimerase family)